jgi:hypothetical protein
MEKKDERKRERLDDYYRRNFGDYLTFERGNKAGVSPETLKQIDAWLERNSDAARQKWWALRDIEGGVK